MTMWLAGMMGSGKTSCGAVAAARLDVPFYDTDVEVTTAFGCTVADLWARIGEAGFRELERAVVLRLAGEEAIVATGGGAVIDPQNRELMTATGPIVWLRATPEELLERVSSVSGRPLLDVSPDRLAELRSISEDRAKWYQEVADHEIDTTAKTIAEVADEIAALWES
ncbi:MAG TPA: shikimate kinase [Acidimicrobiia bacterium]|nr:shikimate kinase [Acidimicrobiia bacterium]